MDQQDTKTNAPSWISRPAAVVLAILAGLFRLLPPSWRPYNLAPVGSLGLFGGARLPHWLAWLLPMAVMLGTDAILWLEMGSDYSFFHYTRFFAYGSFLVYVLLGRALTQTNSPWRIGAAAVAGSVQFFLITNFGEWLFSPENYEKSLSGLVACYVAALPFFHPTLLSDVGFTALLFGGHAVVARYAVPAKQPQPQSS